jgi:protein-L-isoaspartate(D-aspartate) O-methyltransferase
VSAEPSVRLRRRLVRELERRGFVRSRAVRDAFQAVPRERFVPEFAAREGVEAVYRDDAIPTKFRRDGFAISSSSQPAIMAEMLERLELEPGLRVLEVGAGTGYNAALLAQLVGPRGFVTSVDVDAELARGARRALREGRHRVRVVVGDGRDGWPAGAPYDRIVVTASAEEVPEAWAEQLVEGGLLELPLRFDGGAGQFVPTFRRERGRLVSVAIVPGGFMPLRSADDPDAPAPPPTLAATDTASGRGRPLRQLTGACLATLSEPAKRRLLGVALGDGRSEPLGLRADAAALWLYLQLTLPPARRVLLLPEPALGVIGRDGRSLAYIRYSERRPVSRLCAHGGPEAQSRLLAAVARWDKRGRPGPEELRLVVDHARHGRRPRLRLPKANALDALVSASHRPGHRALA